jgi:transposase
VPSHGKRVVILVDHQRWRCVSCGRTFYEPLPDVDEKRNCTRRLIRYLERRSMNRTFLSLAEEVGLHEKTVRRIFHTHVQGLDQTMHIATPRIMGMDELHVIHQARGVITNIEAGTVVELLRDRKKQTVIRYLSNLDHRNRIEVVCMDMWQPYREAVRQCLPDAVIVIDKFHAVKMANQAIEQVRKQVRTGLDEKQRRTLMHDRFLLLRRRSELSEKDTLILETWTKNFPVLGKAYELKEAFFDVWDAPTKDEAHERYFAWQESITLEVSDAFIPIALTVEEWGDELFAYFDHWVTNAYTEALNGLARVANRLGRGYSFDVLRARLLYGIGQHPNRKAKTEKTEEQSVDSESLGVPISTLSEQS